MLLVGFAVILIVLFGIDLLALCMLSSRISRCEELRQEI